MLHALNSKEIAQQQAQSRRLAAQTNSLAMRNNKLNPHSGKNWESDGQRTAAEA